MFHVTKEEVQSILSDFWLFEPVEAITELQRYHYEKKDPLTREVRLILKVDRQKAEPVVVRFKNEQDVTRDLIEQQSAFAHLLFENGVETPRQYQANGCFTQWVTLGGYEVVVTVESFVQGEIHIVEEDTAEKTGALLARTHQIAEKNGVHVANPVLFDPLSDNDLFDFAAFCSHEAALRPLAPALYEQIVTAYETCRQKLFPFKAEPRYAVQGDISDCNLYKTARGDIGLFDFNRCGDNHLYFDTVMQAVFESQLMDYPVGYGEREKEKILAAFLRGYQSVRPFTQEQKETYPYFVAMIRAFWSMDIKWKENSLCQVVEREDWESARAWLQEIDRRLRERPAWPIEEGKE